MLLIFEIEILLELLVSIVVFYLDPSKLFILWDGHFLSPISNYNGHKEVYICQFLGIVNQMGS